MNFGTQMDNEDMQAETHIRFPVWGLSQWTLGAVVSSPWKPAPICLISCWWLQIYKKGLRPTKFFHGGTFQTKCLKSCFIVSEVTVHMGLWWHLRSKAKHPPHPMEWTLPNLRGDTNANVHQRVSAAHSLLIVQWNFGLCILKKIHRSKILKTDLHKRGGFMFQYKEINSKNILDILPFWML